jgi:DNA-binding CsgD family transcriptional regulator
MKCDKCGGTVYRTDDGGACLACGKTVSVIWPADPQEAASAGPGPGPASSPRGSVPAYITDILQDFHFSQRELAIFKMRLNGLGTNDIAGQLDISSSTVRISYYKLRRKMKTILSLF